MLNFVVTLLIIALIAAVFGFGDVASAATEIARVVFFIALVLFLASAVFGVLGGGRTPLA